METNTTFNQFCGGRNWRSEEELINALHSTLDLLCDKHNFNKQQLIDAARSIAPTDFAEWNVLEWAVSGAQTMTRKGRSCGVSNAYNGIIKQQPAHDACGKCDGSGQYVFSTGVVGVCYQCNGSGKD
jgi:DnaJ-class molecular chaperone